MALIENLAPSSPSLPAEASGQERSVRQDGSSFEPKQDRARRPGFRLLISFVLGVLAPAILLVGYFFVVAADQYIAELRFVVRSVEHGEIARAGPAASLSSSPHLPLSASQNAYVVAHYIRGRTIIDAIGQTPDVGVVFRRPEADWWARLRNGASAEDLADYWTRMVTAYVDAPSGIVTVRVRAFRATDALALAQAIERVSERLVNDMSERARQDALRLSEEEVRRATRLVHDMLEELRRARDEEGMIDPAKQADEVGKLVVQLLADRIRLESELFFALRSMARDTPTVRHLETRVGIVAGQIAALRAQMTGERERTISTALRRFDDLEIQRRLAERLLTLAEDGLERARLRAERQHLYLLSFDPPSLPEESRYPHRTEFALASVMALLAIWGIGALLWASVEDHRG